VIARLAAVAALVLQSVQIPALDGRLVDPFQSPAGTKATVLLFVSTDCPISNRYAPDIRRLHETYAKDGVIFRLVYPNPADTLDDIRDHLKSFSYPGTALRDPRHDAVKRAGATITPEAAVYDSRGRLAYRGRIDDRYSAVGIERATATRHDLQDAIASTIAGKPVTPRFTQAVGCYVADFVR
jgi:AhpC/TSA family protein